MDEDTHKFFIRILDNSGVYISVFNAQSEMIAANLISDGIYNILFNNRRIIYNSREDKREEVINSLSVYFSNKQCSPQS